MLLYTQECASNFNLRKNTNMIRVALFEDNDIYRETLADVLSSDEHIEFVGAWTNGTQVDKIMKHYEPQVVLMDIDMPVVNGLQSLDIIHRNYPHINVIMVTIFEEDKYVFQSLCQGAKGYLLKKSTPNKIIEAIQDVYEGGSIMSSVIARKVIQAFSFQQYEKNSSYVLTPREEDILKSLVAGNSYKMIANELEISINTVRQYIRRIYEKLQVHSMNEAVAKAIKERIV